MLRVLLGVVCAGSLCLCGCGKSEKTKSGEELTDQQIQAQKKVDDEEREYQRKQKSE